MIRYITTVIICMLTIITGSAATTESQPAPLQYDPFDQPDFLTAPARPKQPARQASKPDLQLRSILQAGKESVVNLNGRILMIGDSYKGYRLAEVYEQSAVFIKDGKRIRVTLNQ